MTMNISLDLETWGTTPGSDLRSIGACVFDPVTGRTGWPVPTARLPEAFYVATDNPIIDVAEYPDGSEAPVYQYPLTRDPQTVQWWSEQSDEAQAAFADPVDLREALERFAIWLDRLTFDLRPIDNPSEIPGIDGEMINVEQVGVIHDIRRPLHKCDVIRLWCHGPAFDPPIIEAAFRALGLPVPWHYRSPRDTRTIFDAAGIEDHSAWLAQHPGPLGIPHHALDDAICQARGVCGAVARIATPGMVGWGAENDG